MDCGCRRATDSRYFDRRKDASHTDFSTKTPTRIASTATPSSPSIRTAAACCGWEPRMRGSTSSISGSGSSSITCTGPPIPSSLSPGRVKAIHQDPDGVLWVGLFPRALDRLDRKTGRDHPLPSREGDEKTLGRRNQRQQHLQRSVGLSLGRRGWQRSRPVRRAYRTLQALPARRRRSPQPDFEQRLHDLWRPKRPDVGGPRGWHQPLRSRDGRVRQLPPRSRKSGQPGQYGVGHPSRSFGRAVGRHVGRYADPIRRRGEGVREVRPRFAGPTKTQRRRYQHHPRRPGRHTMGGSVRRTVSARPAKRGVHPLHGQGWPAEQQHSMHSGRSTGQALAQHPEGRIPVRSSEGNVQELRRLRRTAEQRVQYRVFSGRGWGDLLRWQQWVQRIRPRERSG